MQQTIFFSYQISIWCFFHWFSHFHTHLNIYQFKIPIFSIDKFQFSAMFFPAVILIWVKSTPKWSCKRCLYYPPNCFLIWGKISGLGLEIDLFYIYFFFTFNHKLSSCIDWRRSRSQRKKNTCRLALACESIEIRYGLRGISNLWILYNCDEHGKSYFPQFIWCKLRQGWPKRAAAEVRALSLQIF